MLTVLCFNTMTFSNSVYLFFCLSTIITLRHVKCNEDINPCDEKFDIVTDYSHKDCGEGYFYKKTGNGKHKCFSSCVPYDLTSPCSDDNPCPPGYICPNPGGTDVCQIDESSCLKEHLKPSNPWKDAWKPTCHPDGSWAAKQCKGESKNGRCFCYDIFGSRIYGQAFFDKSENMTCSCSRRKDEIRRQGTRFYTTLHCDTMGNYEPLQCDDGQCWCAETKTGKIISKVVPDTMMSLLPCYTQSETGTTYLRPCESEEFAQKNILHEFDLHGTSQINFPHVMCDDDGNYGNYQIRGAQAYCRWIDNSNIQNFAAEVNEFLRDLNCYCARDSKIFQTVGATQYLLCESNGNYRRQQYHIIDNKWYCVDKDGFKNSDYFDEKDYCSQYPG